MATSRPRPDELDLEDVPAASLASRSGTDLSCRVVEEVLRGARQCFEEEGLGEDVIQRFQQLWLAKIAQREMKAGQTEREMQKVQMERQQVLPAQPCTSSSGARPKTFKADKKEETIVQVRNIELIVGST